MGPKLALPDLERWLADNGRTMGTADVYVKRIRLLLRSPEEAAFFISHPDEAKAEILRLDAGCTRAGRCVFRAAMRALDGYMQSRGKASILPSFPDGRRRNAEKPPITDHPLAPLLARMAVNATIPWGVLEQLKWGHVQGNRNAPHLRICDPGDRVTYQVPTDVLRGINLWAGGGKLVEDQNTPIVPREPLSLWPMPAAMLRSLARSAATTGDQGRD